MQSEIEDWDDDPPSADPKIKLEYEAALGKFILAYNQIDFYMSKILNRVVSNPDNAIKKKLKSHYFSDKLFVLRLLSNTTEGKDLAKLPFTRLEQLNADRNKFAHGHMEQNPFDGSFDIIGRKPVNNASTEKLTELAEQANLLWDELRLIEVSYDFKEI